MASIQKIIPKVSVQLGMNCEKSKKTAYGVYRGYTVLILGDNSSTMQRITVSLCASSNGEAPNPLLIQGAISDNIKYIPDKFRINLLFVTRGGTNENVTWIANAVQSLINTLLSAELQNCDEWGVIGTTSIYRLKGRYTFLNEVTAEISRADIAKAAYSASLTQEKYGAGILGALLGAAGGSLLVFLVARLGFVSTLSSAALGFAVVFCYKKFAGKLSIISSVLCVLISVASTYLAFRLDAALDLFKAFKESAIRVDFSDCFKHAKEFYELAGSLSTYSHNFVLMMLAGTVGAITSVCLLYSDQKEEFEMQKLG